MIQYAIGRLANGFVMIAILITLIFLLTHTLGDPALIMLPLGTPEEVIGAFRDKFGFNLPLHVQFANFAKGLMRGDFGVSFWQGTPNLEIFFRHFPATLWLASAAGLLALFVGVVLGALAAARQGSALDRATMTLTSLAMSSVDFWIGLLLVLFVSVRLGWLPTSGYGDWRFLILPAVTLALRPTGRIAQVSRAAILDEIGKEYVIAARARGLTRWNILWKHVVRNAGTVIVTMGGYEFMMMINGSVVVESIFSWPGIGLLTLQAVQHRDWPLIVTIATVVAVIVVLLHLLLDFVYAWLDPRVRYG